MIVDFHGLLMLTWKAISIESLRHLKFYILRVSHHSSHLRYFNVKSESALLDLMFLIKKLKHDFFPTINFVHNICMYVLVVGNGAPIPGFPRPEFSGTGWGRGQASQKFRGIFGD